MRDNGNQVEILLVEDNQADVRLTVEALKEGKISNHLNIARDGMEATDFLKKRGKFANAPDVELILLDLNLPKKDGRSVLAEIKEDENLRRIPVVVMTTSKAEEDIIKSYNLHANCYIIKPIDFDKFIDVVKAIEDFWVSIVTLPKGGRK